MLILKYKGIELNYKALSCLQQLSAFFLLLQLAPDTLMLKGMLIIAFVRNDVKLSKLRRSITARSQYPESGNNYLWRKQDEVDTKINRRSHDK